MKDHGLALIRNGQALPALRTATLQDLLPILGLHADQEPVRPLTTAVVWLKCTLSLRHSGSSIKPLILCGPLEQCKGLDQVIE